MTEPTPESRALLRVKRRNCFLLAAVLFGGLVVHLVGADPIQPLLALTLLAWSLSFVGLGAVLVWGWLSVRRLAVYSAAFSLVFATALIHLTGGPRSLYFPMLGALPLTLVIFAPHARMISLVASVLTVSVVVLLDVLARMPLREMVQQVSGFVMIGAVAFAGVETYQRMRDAEKAAQRERLVALEQLTESERRRVHAERERSEMERLVLVGQLATGVAHEVNNPLAFVKSNLFFLKEELQQRNRPPDWEEVWQVFAETQEGVRRIQQIISDLRSFSREDTHDEAEGWPRRALEEAIRQAGGRLSMLNGEVMLDVDEDLPPVQLEQRFLRQVLVNLLVNAVDAVEGAVPARRANIQVKGRRVEGAVRMEVEDNGPGISEDVMKRIFDPFFTTKQTGQGLGLGLALCREFASRSGGSLLAENRAEGGARFVLVLPEKPAQSPGFNPR